MSPLWLVRHGACTGVEPGTILGQRDPPLAPAAWTDWRGRVQPWAVALGPVAVVASDLRRCAEPAAALAADAVRTPALREQDFGAWEGRTWAELPADAAPLIDPVAGRAPGGESFAEVWARVTALVPVLPPGPALVIAHAGSLRALAGLLLGLPPLRALDLAWGHGAACRIDRYAPAAGVLRWHQGDGAGPLPGAH